LGLQALRSRVEGRARTRPVLRRMAVKMAENCMLSLGSTA